MHQAWMLLCHHLSGFRESEISHHSGLMARPLIGGWLQFWTPNAPYIGCGCASCCAMFVINVSSKISGHGGQCRTSRRVRAQACISGGRGEGHPVPWSTAASLHLTLPDLQLQGSLPLYGTHKTLQFHDSLFCMLGCQAMLNTQVALLSSHGFASLTFIGYSFLILEESTG